jgi:hypothetical protein
MSSPTLVGIALAFSVVLSGQTGARVPAAGDHPRGYVAYRAATAPTIDGRLDDRAWQAVPWTDPFVDIEGSARSLPRLLTRARIVWDDHALYIGATMEEPHIWATLTQHDSVIFRDHDFEIFIDPNGDNHEYYELEVNALNTTWDLLLPKPYKDEGRAVNGWEIAGLRTAVALDGTLNNWRDIDQGWSVEIALPWAALGELARRTSPPVHGDQWRINFSRVEWQLRWPPDSGAEGYRVVPGTKEANWVWSPQHVIDMHRPEQWGYLQFSTALPGTTPFVPDPAWAAKRWLHEVYYAQVAYRKIHARWATTLTELGVAGPSAEGVTAPTLTTAGGQFEVTVTSETPGREPERWVIRQDSQLKRGGG